MLLWHRHDFPDVEVIEICPSIDMGGMMAMLDFSTDYVQTLMKTGYSDAKRTFENIQKALGNLKDLRHSTETLIAKVSDNSHTQQVENAMERLRKLSS